MNFCNNYLNSKKIMYIVIDFFDDHEVNIKYSIFLFMINICCKTC